MRAASPLIVAADVGELSEAVVLAERLRDRVAMMKVGLGLFTKFGPDAVRAVASAAPVFLDLKLHDIPSVVDTAASNLGRLGVSMLTVHAAGGIEMLQAALEGARRGADQARLPPPRVLAVTTLSSSADEPTEAPAVVARRAVDAGADGVVASGPDVRLVRDAVGAHATIVVPGIRPLDSPTQDQHRTLTPLQALEAGATFLVVGRPILDADDPRTTAERMFEDIS
jgi:orotidine-5'-phosphate decarboxylase